MASKKIILFNGPPRSGKDTATDAVIRSCPSVDFHIVKFTEVVKDITHRDLGLPVYHDYYELLKDTPLTEFNGKSPRQAYITTSQKLKEKHGEDIVARLTAAKISNVEQDYIICPDVGYNFEAKALLAYADNNDCVLIRIHKAGHTFDNDCRERVEISDIANYDIVNIEGRSDFFGEEIIKRVADRLPELTQSSQNISRHAIFDEGMASANL